MSITEQIKVKGKIWHDHVESQSPIASLFRAPFSRSLEDKLDVFKLGLKPLWKEVVAHAGEDETSIILRESFTSIFKSEPDRSVPQSVVQSYAMKYMLLGSSMGSAFIYKTLQEKVTQT